MAAGQVFEWSHHSKTGQFVRFSNYWASLDRFIYKRVIKTIFFYIKRSSLAPFENRTKNGVRSGFRMVKNKMAAIAIRKPDNLSGFRIIGTSLDRFIYKRVIKSIFFYIKRSSLAPFENRTKNGCRSGF